MARVVEVPVPRFDPVTLGHVGEQRSTGVRRQNVEGGRGDANFDGPVYGATEDLRTVSVEAEDEAAVDHDAEAVEPAYDLAIVAAEVLALAGALEAARGERFEPNEQAPESCRRRVFDAIIAQDRVDSCGCLKDAAHSFHAAEEISGEPGIPEEMIVQEVEMSAGKAGNFGKRVIHELRIERAPSCKETILVAEGAMMRTASRDDN